MNLMLLAALALGADAEPGPKAGAGVPKLPATVVTDKAAEKEIDLSGDRKDEPTVYVFVNADQFKDTPIPFGRPAHQFLKTLDEKVADVTGAKVVAVWVGGNADKIKEYLPKIDKYYSNTTRGVSTADSNGPKDWALAGTATVTAVVAHKGKAVKGFAFESVNATDVKGVMESLKAAAEKK